MMIFEFNKNQTNPSITRSNENQQFDHFTGEKNEKVQPQNAGFSASRETVLDVSDHDRSLTSRRCLDIIAIAQNGV